MEKVFTYLIKSCKDGSYYVGITKNPIKRLKSHNQGNQKSTAQIGPFELVYCKEHKDYSEARKHEKWLKKKSREYKNSLVKKFADVAQLVEQLHGKE